MIFMGEAPYSNRRNSIFDSIVESWPRWIGSLTLGRLSISAASLPE